MSFGLYVLYSQASSLSKAKTSNISVGFISVDYIQEKKLSIHYWLPSPVVATATSTPPSLSKYPAIEVSIDESSSGNRVGLSIKHIPPLIHPIHGSVVAFSLVNLLILLTSQKPSELNIEQLLLRVQRMHGYIKLYKLYAILSESNLFSSSVTLPNISADSSGI